MLCTWRQIIEETFDHVELEVVRGYRANMPLSLRIKACGSSMRTDSLNSDDPTFR